MYSFSDSANVAFPNMYLKIGSCLDLGLLEGEVIEILFRRDLRREIEWLLVIAEQRVYRSEARRFNDARVYAGKMVFTPIGYGFRDAFV